MGMIRIDRFLANSGFGTRSQVKALISKGNVSIGGKVVRDPAFKVEENTEDMKINGIPLVYNKYVYIMLNKPSGVVSAVSDSQCKTVVDILGDDYRDRKLFPVGRLDKDTRGLVILTNDGDFAHNTLSPKKHVDKVYYLECQGKLDTDAVDKIKDGVVIDGDYKCKPALLNIIEYADNKTFAEITISEGKFHQVKKMISAVGGRVTALKRVKFGDISLDAGLKEGEYRLLNEKEMEFVSKIKKG